MAQSSLVQEDGSTWRRMINFLADKPIEPSILMPLLSHMGAEQRQLNDPELIRDIDFLSIGFSLWRSQRSTLFEWARRCPHEQLSEYELQEWWWSGETKLLRRDEYERVEEFFDMIRLEGHQAVFMNEFAQEYPQSVTLHIYYLRRDMAWLYELELFRILARKTWGKPKTNPADVRWDWEEFAFIDKYFSEQQPSLEPICDDDEIDPFSLRIKYYEMGVGFGLHELSVRMMVIVRDAVIDFMNEIFDFGHYHSIRGSLSCVECGQFVARRERGYGQQYCSDRCKKRAAKRRYRSRANTKKLH